MQADKMLSKLNAELEVTKMGEHRKFKFIKNHLKDEQLTVAFFVNVLGYKRWQANRIKDNIKYRKRIYQQQKLILRQ